MIRSGLVLCFVLAAGAGLEPDRPWADKKPGDWTLADTEKVLWESPWTVIRRFGFFDRFQNQREGRYCVRLQSALPIRLALAQAYQLQPEEHVVRPGAAVPAKTEEIAAQLHFDDEIVFALIIFPPFLHRRLNEQDPVRVVKETSLVVDGRKVPLKAFVPPDQSSFGEAWFRFADPDHRDVTRLKFTTTVHLPYRMKVSAEFQMKDLVFEDNSEY